MNVINLTMELDIPMAESVYSSPNDEYQPAASSVANYAYREEQNIRFRPAMEDAHIIIDGFMSNPTQGYFALFDGHGGTDVVNFCLNYLHEALSESIALTPENLQLAFSNCFHRVDERVKELGATHVGTTATIGFTRIENFQKVLYIVNVGDSKGFLISNEGVLEVTETHTGHNPSEINRILNEGGTLIRGRVSGLLGVSRALGDHFLKGKGVSCQPFVQRILVNSGMMLILGSDGVWDVVLPTVLEGAHYQDSDIVAGWMLKKALDSGSHDNVSVLVVKF